MDMDDVQEMIEDAGFHDWEVQDDVTLICPHGNTIEWDGQCSKGCISPLMELGLI